MAFFIELFPYIFYNLELIKRRIWLYLCPRAAVLVAGPLYNIQKKGERKWHR